MEPSTIVAPAEQGTEQWLLDRSGRVTASNADKVMMAKTTAGYQGYLTQLALERLFGRPIETFKNKAMERGNELEDTARMRYMLATKNAVQEAFFVPHETIMAGASPDGYVGTDGLVEFKCPLAHNHLHVLRNGTVPNTYKWQVAMQQWITGRKWTDFVSFSDEFPPNAALAIIRVERDEEMIADLEDRVKMFLSLVEETERFVREYGKT